MTVATCTCNPTVICTVPFLEEAHEAVHTETADESSAEVHNGALHGQNDSCGMAPMHHQSEAPADEGLFDLGKTLQAMRVKDGSDKLHGADCRAAA